MTTPDARKVTVALAEGDQAALEALIDEVMPVYQAAFSEPPYRMGPEQFEKFATNWPRRIERPGYRLALARNDEGETVGFGYGHQIGATWWSGLLDEVDPGIIKEWPGRTFATIDLAVLAPYRRQGIGRQINDLLIGAGDEERATLLVRRQPELEHARHTYRTWGYHRLGRLRPFPDAQIYDAMLNPAR